MSGILRKVDLEGSVESFYEEDITPDIHHHHISYIFISPVKSIQL